MSQVIESTGVVVTPYMEYPQLLGMLLHMLSEGSPHARTEVLKVHRTQHSCFTLPTNLFFSKTTSLLVPDHLLHMQVTLNIAVPVVACVQMHRIVQILLCKNALYGMVHQNQHFGIHIWIVLLQLVHSPLSQFMGMLLIT